MIESMNEKARKIIFRILIDCLKLILVSNERGVGCGSNSTIEEPNNLLSSGRVEGASSVELDIEIGITVGHGA